MRILFALLALVLLPGCDSGGSSGGSGVVNSIKCADHRVTKCRWQAGGNEVERLFSADCTVKFYEFGQHYYTGTWKPVSATKITVQGPKIWTNSTYEGIMRDDRRYQEGYTVYSCR